MKVEFQNNLKLFINEVMCRRDHNQRRAKKLWEQIKFNINESDRKLFETEWRGHYIHTGEHSPHDFSYWVSKLLKPYLDKVD